MIYQHLHNYPSLTVKMREKILIATSAHQHHHHHTHMHSFTGHQKKSKAELAEDSAAFLREDPIPRTVTSAFAGYMILHLTGFVQQALLLMIMIITIFIFKTLI